MVNILQKIRRAGIYSPPHWLFFLLLFFASISMAAEPGWRSVPEDLKKAAGVQAKDGYIYATGVAEVGKIRPDKAHEVARKKSLLHALQLIHITHACNKIVQGLDPHEQREFFLLFAPFSSAIHVEGLTVIRQWEKGNHHFTTVAVPVGALENIECEFQDLPLAISRYVEMSNVTLSGLCFCLRHTPRYSQMAHKAKSRIGDYFVNQGMKSLARCFYEERMGVGEVNNIQLLALQNATLRASQLTSLAQKAAQKHDWDNALRLASETLDLIPTFGRAYLVLADYFLHKQKRPSLALCAAEKALRDGTCLRGGFKRIVSCMEALESPEAEVYQFILSRFEDDSQVLFPKIWQHELDRLSDKPIAYIVIASAGRAVEGGSKSRGLLFAKAAGLFSHANNDEDVAQALQMLFRACEEQPASAETYNLIGACYRHLGKPSIALPFLWQSLNLRPEYDYALTNLGLCCQKLGLMRAAKYYFEQDAVRNSTNSWVKQCYLKFQETIK